MYPNTFMMQELIRRNFDENAEREEEGKQVDVPYIFTIPKGWIVREGIMDHPRADGGHRNTNPGTPYSSQ
jgi:hypothetical protein